MKKADVSPLIYMIIAIVMAIIMIAVAVVMFKGLVGTNPMPQ